MSMSLHQRIIHRLGWRPDMPDERDHMFSAPSAVLAVLPPVVDLRPNCPPVYDQGDIGSCTANAICAALQFDRFKQLLTPDFIPSRLFVYYHERVIERSVDYDAGAEIRDGIKVIAQLGAPPEADWPYDTSKMFDEPTMQAHTDALSDRALQYARVTRSVQQMRGCLAAGFPFVFGFSVYESFESDVVAATGLVPMPNTAQEYLLGGHAVLAVGYDHAEQRFLVRNSWGDKWGIGGYFTMPYSYLLSRGLASDFWVVRLVSQA